MAELLIIARLPETPGQAQDAFADQYRHEAERTMRTADLTLVLPSADHTHRAWRSAAVQTLARQAAPFRVNMVAGDDRVAIAKTCDYLATAKGVTGQYLVTDGPRVDFAVARD